MRSAMRPLCVAALAAIFWLAGPAIRANAQEVILSFDSSIVVEPNGALLVTERIRVRALGQRIRRGIFRDFPTVKRSPSGLVRTQTFELLNAERDGQAEGYRFESIAGGRRVYLGREDVFLKAGEYTYLIRYRSRRQIGFFDNHDEVYWNVTGTGWRFPILHARAEVVLPPGARILQQAAYTGPFGATGSDARVVSQSDNRIAWATTRMLKAGEGLTVSAGFQKGVVPEPSSMARTVRGFWDNLGLWLLLIGVPAIGIGYFRKWLLVGRDPPKGIVIPLFSPPRELSPAAVSYIHFRGTGVLLRGVSRAFVAALMSLGVKGRLRMSEIGGDLTLQHTATDGSESLPPGERAIERTLLASERKVTVNRTNQKLIASAMAAFEKALKSEYAGKYFNFNFGWTIAFAVLSILVAVGFFVLFPVTDAQIGLVLFLGAAAFVGGSMLMGGVRRLTGDVPGGSSIFGFIMLALGIVALLPIGFALLGAFGAVSFIDLRGGDPVTHLIVAALTGLVLVNVVFSVLLFAPTLEGRRLMDEIDGFKLYLSVAEADRMNMAGRPDFSVGLFERYLPYAIGLAVERPWSQALDAHLAKALPGEATSTSYRPTFYSGKGWNSANIAASAGAMASTLGASFSSAIPSSSGSGGRGSSGGGGGGGGGGGW